VIGMTRSATGHAVRQRSAETAYRALGPSPSEHAVLVVHCAGGHHVAAVYATGSGLVYASVPWRHAHGDRDRHDAAHHGGHRDTLWLDWLATDGGVSADDPLPAGCECGARTFTRARLEQAMADGVHRLVID